MSRPRKHHVKKIWHPDTLEMQRRARKLLLAHGYPKKAYSSVFIDIRSDLRVFYHDRRLSVSFQGTMVYVGHDDTGPCYEDKDLREQIHDALLVLRHYMILNDLANV